MSERKCYCEHLPQGDDELVHFEKSPRGVRQNYAPGPISATATRLAFRKESSEMGGCDLPIKSQRESIYEARFTFKE